MQLLCAKLSLLLMTRLSWSTYLDSRHIGRCGWHFPHCRIHQSQGRSFHTKRQVQYLASGPLSPNLASALVLEAIVAAALCPCAIENSNWTYSLQNRYLGSGLLSSKMASVLIQTASNFSNQQVSDRFSIGLTNHSQPGLGLIDFNLHVSSKRFALLQKAGYCTKNVFVLRPSVLSPECWLLHLFFLATAGPLSTRDWKVTLSRRSWCSAPASLFLRPRWCACDRRCHTHARTSVAAGSASIPMMFQGCPK